MAKVKKLAKEIRKTEEKPLINFELLWDKIDFWYFNQKECKKCGCCLVPDIYEVMDRIQKEIEKQLKKGAKK